LYRFSDRLSWPVLPNGFSRLIDEKRQRGIRLLDLTNANPTEAFAEYPHADIGRAYAKIHDFAYRPDPLGIMEARQAVAYWYGKRGIRIGPKQIALTASTSEAYSLLFKLLCNPEEEVLIPTPSYPLFEYLASVESVKAVPYRLGYDGSWFIDFESLRRAITTQSRAIVIVNPNNPTGSFLKRQELGELYSIAKERSLPVISDEVFMDYGWSPDPRREPTLIGHNDLLSFSLNGLSKSAGMPQMKLGWIAVNGPIAEQGQAMERLELLLDTFLSVGTPAQYALPGLLATGEEMRSGISRRIRANNEALRELLRNTPVHPLHGEGGWSAILQLPSILTEEIWITRLLDEHGVIVQPGYFFDMPSEAFVVVSLITETADFIEGIAGLRRLVESAAREIK
jgi:aspartate/methionine/tyrosine aminotransferase